MTPSGYSGTPLAKKLGIKAGMTLGLVNAPADYFRFFSDFPDDVSLSESATGKKHLIHCFFQWASELERQLPLLRRQIAPDGVIWVSWYKKAAKMETDITEDRVREVALPNGLVDIKVCAVSEIWSGLKLVIPVARR